MGISTVSGPFRSKNGFQELVDGVWTPVGGGGVSSSLIYTEAPAARVDLDLTEVGKSITVVGNSGSVYDNFEVQFTFGNLTSDIERRITGFLYVYNVNFITRNSIDINNTYALSFNLIAPFEVTFTGLGLFIPAGQYVEKQNIAMAGWVTNFNS